MKLHNIKSEGEVYSTEARVELTLTSYLKIVFFVSIGWAIGGTLLSLFLTLRLPTPHGPSHFNSFPTILISASMWAMMGFMKAFIAGLIGYPVYKFWCSKNRGQYMYGKFAILIKSDTSIDDDTEK